MSALVEKYVVNFWIWWYVVQHKDVVFKLFGLLSTVYNLLNIGPMLGNLFTPMFQDKSRVGRFIAFPIRLTWGGGGLVIVGVLIVPCVFAYLFYLILPLMPIWATLYYLQII